MKAIGQTSTIMEVMQAYHIVLSQSINHVTYIPRYLSQESYLHVAFLLTSRAFPSLRRLDLGRLQVPYQVLYGDQNPSKDVCRYVAEGSSRFTNEIVRS